MRFPKQFLSLGTDKRSLLQATVDRIKPLVADRVWLMSGVSHLGLIKKQVPSAHVICEPVGRNTAAAIGLAALHLQKSNPNCVMLVLPADHAVSSEQLLRDALGAAARLAAEKDLLVTVGIKPTSPNTAYGYIKCGARIGETSYAVGRFYEKPNELRAKQYAASPDFYWNSGMFAWRPRVILDAIANYLPAMYETLMHIEPLIGKSDSDKKLAELFESLESVSIDFGVLEHARNCAVVVPEAFGWNDVGSWDAWAEHFEKEQNGNLLRGDALVVDSKNCVVHSENRLTAVLGAENLVVIDTKDALLICPRERVQEVRKIVDELKKRGRDELV